MERRLAVDDRWIAERQAGWETERREAKRGGKTRRENRVDVFIPPLEDSRLFCHWLWAGENNAAEIQCKFLKASTIIRDA